MTQNTSFQKILGLWYHRPLYPIRAENGVKMEQAIFETFLSRFANTTVEHSPVIIVLSCEHKPMTIKQPYIWGCEVHNTLLWQWLLTSVRRFFFRPHLTHQLCLSAVSARVRFFLRSGKISFPPPSCEPPSLFISNVSSGTEESLFPPPWCRLQRGIQMREPGEASWGSSILWRFAHRNRLLSQQERAGVSWPRVRFCLSLLQDFIKKHKNTQTKNTSSSALSCNSIIHTSLLQGDLSRNSQGCRIETPRKRGLSAEILVEV